MSSVCPLSGSQNVELIEKFHVQDLLKLYDRLLGIDVTSEFKDVREIGFYRCPGCDLRFFSPAVTGSESFYQTLQKFDWYYMEEKDEYSYASQYISERDSVLDVGCGKGAFASAIKAKNYVGLEFSKSARLMAEENGIHVINETVEVHSDKNSERYDVVCAFQVLEHVPDVSSFVAASIKCLKPSGLLILSVPSADSFLSSVTNGMLNMPPHHVTWWSDESLQSLVRIFNLEIVDLFHETLSDVHAVWYSETVVLNALNRVFNRRFRLIDRGVFHRLAFYFAHFIGNFCKLGIDGRNMRPLGHSVIAVYRKPTQ